MMLRIYLKGEVRAEIILLQAHVEFMIDEIIEVLLETNALRGTKSRLDLKLRLLKDLGWLTEEIIHDVKVLSTIRGYVAHRLDVYQGQTRIDIENQFKLIKLIKRADPIFFPQDKSLQIHLRNVSELYFRILYDVYDTVYKVKAKQSLENPDSLRDDYRFEKDQNGDAIIVHDTI